MTESESHPETPEPIYVQNESSLDKVEPRFLPVIEDAKQIYHEVFGDELRSVYLFGSVGRGDYIEAISDLDTKAYLDREPTDAEQEQLDELRAGVMDKYPWLAKLDIEPLPLSVIETSPRAAFLIKTEGVLLDGEPIEVNQQFPPIGPELAKFLCQNFANNLRQRGHGYLKDTGGIPMVSRSRWLAKNALRFGLGLVMMKQPFYTHNVNDMAPVAKEVYPELAAVIDRINAVSAQPLSGDFDGYRQLLDDCEAMQAKGYEVGLLERPTSS